MNEANRRIARNSLFIYLRIVSMVVVGLYLSRVVINLLGPSDFGLFAVVGGLMGLCAFITGSLANATSRFLNVEMGLEHGDVNRCFNVNVLLHAVLALIIFVVAETAGLWYVLHGLNVEAGRLGHAVFVYQVSILTTCLGVLSSPYQSLFQAKERFRFIALLDIINIFVRLGCVLMLTLYDGAYTLCLYSVIYSLTSVNTFVIFFLTSRRLWPAAVRLRFVRGWHHYRATLSFSSWNLLSALATTGRSSGSDLLINAFFNTVVNGAFAIGKSICTYIFLFSANFDSAAAPQIIQSYTQGDMGRVTFLVNHMGRYNLLLFMLVLFPLWIELDFVLHLWLGVVPEGTLSFVRLYILVAGVALTSGGIGPLQRAYGRIKWFQIELSVFFLLCLPVGYVLFAIGCPPYTILVCFVVADILNRTVQLVLIRHLIGYDALGFVRSAYLRPAVIAALMSGVLWLYSHCPAAGAGGKCAAIAACFVLTALLVFFIGLNSAERRYFAQRIFKK